MGNRESSRQSDEAMFLFLGAKSVTLDELQMGLKCEFDDYVMVGFTGDDEVVFGGGMQQSLSQKGVL